VGYERYWEEGLRLGIEGGGVVAVGLLCEVMALSPRIRSFIRGAVHLLDEACIGSPGSLLPTFWSGLGSRFGLPLTVHWAHHWNTSDPCSDALHPPTGLYYRIYRLRCPWYPLERTQNEWLAHFSPEPLPTAYPWDPPPRLDRAGAAQAVVLVPSLT
jgi:hypothetical protein